MDNIESNFSVGYVSPVNVDSLIKRSFDSRILQSAGILSPDFRITISPGTIYSIGISSIFPFRKTFDFIFINDNNLSIPFDAFFSYQKPRNELIRTIERIIEASSTSLSNNVSKAVKINIIIIGFCNCAINNDNEFVFLWVFIVLCPYSDNLSFASIEDSPFGLVFKRLRRT